MTTTAKALTIDDYLLYHSTTPEDREQLSAKVQALKNALEEDPVVLVNGNFEITRPMVTDFFGQVGKETYTYGSNRRELGLVVNGLTVQESASGVPELALDYRTVAEYIHSLSFSQLGHPALWLYPRSDKIAFPVDAPHGDHITYEHAPEDVQRYTLPIEVVRGITLEDGFVSVPKKESGSNTSYLHLGELSSVIIVDGLMFLSKEPKDKKMVDLFIAAASKNLDYHRAA